MSVVPLQYRCIIDTIARNVTTCWSIGSNSHSSRGKRLTFRLWLFCSHSHMTPLQQNGNKSTVFSVNRVLNLFFFFCCCHDSTHTLFPVPTIAWWRKRFKFVHFEEGRVCACWRLCDPFHRGVFPAWGCSVLDCCYLRVRARFHQGSFISKHYTFSHFIRNTHPSACCLMQFSRQPIPRLQHDASHPADTNLQLMFKHKVSFIPSKKKGSKIV